MLLLLQRIVFTAGVDWERRTMGEEVELECRCISSFSSTGFHFLWLQHWELEHANIIPLICVISFKPEAKPLPRPTPQIEEITTA